MAKPEGDIIPLIDDMILQATTERSHYYTAAVFRAARTEIEMLRAFRRRVVKHLAQRYRDGQYLIVAELCDDQLDQSGALLGEVRDVVREPLI